MGFEKIEVFEGRHARTPIINVRIDGQIYLGTSLCLAYPITPDHKTTDIYIDLESGELAVHPMTSSLGHFGLSKAGDKSRAINCRRFLNQYGIVRNEKYNCEIKTINGERMIVFQPKIDQAKKPSLTP